MLLWTQTIDQQPSPTDTLGMSALSAEGHLHPGLHEEPGVKKLTQLRSSRNGPNVGPPPVMAKVLYVDRKKGYKTTINPSYCSDL